MKRKSEKRYVDKYWKRMRAHVESFVKTADQEDLHQFRVQVKKLRALLVMMESTSKNARLKKDFKPIKKVFKEAGDIRSAFVNLELSDEYHFKTLEFEKQQNESIKHGTEAFVAKGAKQLKKLRRSRHRIHKNVHQLKKKVITRFYEQNLNDVAAFFERIKFTDELHECRKKIKFLLYNQKPAHKAISSKLQLDHDYLDKLQETLGKWHDNILALDLLEAADNMDETARKSIRENDDRLKRQIVELATDFRTKAFVPEPKQKDKAELQQ